MTIPGGLARPALEWALTYALHSTLLLGLVALLTHRLVRSDVWRETLWRGALFGSVLTAAMATSLPFAPLAGRLEVPGIGTPSSPAADAAVQTGRSSAATGAPASPRSAAPGRQGPAERRSDTGAATGTGSWAGAGERPSCLRGRACRLSCSRSCSSATWPSSGACGGAAASPKAPS